MFMKKTTATVLAITLLCGLTAADTVYLKNGVRFDGKVTERPNGLFLIEAGPRKLVYRPDDIKRVEKNERTGHFNLEEAKARAAKRNQELTELTGLTQDQRRIVKKLLFELQRSEGNVRHEAREKLKALQGEMDAFAYLELQLPGLSNRLQPPVLEAMFYIDGTRCLPALREHIDSGIPGTRAAAIQCLAAIGDIASLPLMARGLVDSTEEVRMAAAYAMATLGAKHATPALIELLRDTELRVAGASRKALEAMWKEAAEGKLPIAVDEWRTFWEAHAAGEPIQLAALEALVAPEDEFEDE